MTDRQFVNLNAPPRDPARLEEWARAVAESVSPNADVRREAELTLERIARDEASQS